MAGAIEECGYQKVARGNTRLLRRTRTSGYLESAFGALASPPSGEMRLPNVREGKGSPEDLGGTLAPDSNPKDGTSGGTANGARTRQADAAGGISQNRTWGS